MKTTMTTLIRIPLFLVILLRILGTAFFNGLIITLKARRQKQNAMSANAQATGACNPARGITLMPTR